MNGTDLTRPSRRRFLASCGLAAAAWGATGLLPRRAWANLRAEDAFEWQELAKGVYATGGMETGGNVLLIVRRGEAVLVDTKFAQCSTALKREAESRGGPVKIVINTHHHGDHTGGNHAFTGASDVYCQEHARERIASQFQNYQNQILNGPRTVEGQFKAPALDVVKAEAEELLKRMESLTAASWTPTKIVSETRIDLPFKGERIQVFHFGPGHTDNDLLVYLPDQNILHTGDLLFNRLHPFFDPAGGSTCQGWIRRLEEAIAICNNDTVVVPGHGPVGSYFDLRRQADYLVQLWDAVGKEIKAGKPKEEIVAMSWPFMDGLGFEQIRPRAIDAVYDEATAPVLVPAEPAKPERRRGR